MSYYRDVGDFHEKFNLPTRWGKPQCEPMKSVEYRYRIDFLREELAEFEEAVAAGSLERQLDALADLVYVALGTAHYLGAPFDDVWVAVHSANMRKVLRTDSDPTHKRGRIERIHKPEGWKSPDILAVIENYNVLRHGSNP